ncbi:MAG: hydrolase [Candidatus Bathyarchaeota archaeon]|nr:hydrolase [Candidatus Bathyarchaeota archaeon]
MMPFTPFHWGPGLLFGLLLLSYVDLPTLLVSSVVIDVEPFVVLALNLRYPLHGYLHTFVGGTIVAFLLALVMSRVRGTLLPLMSFLRLEQKTSFKSIVIASLFGIYLHILLDSPLYPDIRPFYPLQLNPLLGHSMFISFDIYTFCVLSFIGAAIVYAARLFLGKQVERAFRDLQCNL